MTTKLRLADGLTLPVDFITMRSLWLGVSGSGKSTAARLLAEAVHDAGQRFCVIDLKNDWWGLKSSADGKSAAIPVVIIGGPRGDIPLDENAGSAVADIVAEVPSSFVIDLDALSKGKGIRFLGAFLERLYHVNRDPLLLVCDEADRYAPQKPMSPEANVTLGAADDIARRGRKRGIGSLWITQRPAVIAKNVTTQCELVATFRTPSELDQKELRAHIGRVASPEQIDETMRSVGGLGDGQGIFLSQHRSIEMFKTVQLPMPRTFDSSATPKVGQRRIEPKQLAAPDLAALGERIKATVEKAKAEDPKELRARIRQLEVELARAAKVAPSTSHSDIERAREAGAADYARRILRETSKGTERRTRAVKEAIAAIERLGGLVQQIAAPIELPDAGATAPAPRETPAATRAPVPTLLAPRPSEATPRRTVASGTSGALPSMHRKFLTALAQHPAGLTKAQVLTHTTYASSGPTSAAFAELSRDGLISVDRNMVTITGAGLDKLGPFEPLPVGAELREHLTRTLPKMEATLLGVVFEHHPATIGKGEILNRAGYASSGPTSAAFARLTRLGYVVRRGNGLHAAPEMFE